MSKPVRIVFLPDLHFGHPKILPSLLYDNLVDIVYPELEKADLIILGGDQTHTSLNLDSNAALYMLMLKKDLEHMVMKNGSYLRILQGTFTHDRNQNQIFNFGSQISQHKGRQGDYTVRFFKGMEVERNVAFSMDILYLPDDLPFENVLLQAKELLSSHNLKKVHLIVHHGYCQHLLPPAAHLKLDNVFSADEYAEITDGLVLNGHVHIPSIFKNVVSGGSFERMNHGEEHPKGFHVIDYDPTTNKKTIKFVTNKYATPFVTVDLVKCEHDSDEAVKYFNKMVEPLSKGLRPEQPVYVRVITDNVELRQSISQYAKRKYPLVHITTERSKTGRESTEVATHVELDLPIINRDNLPEHVHRRLEGKLTIEEIKSVLIHHEAMDEVSDTEL